jgi:hypothetical protein
MEPARSIARLGFRKWYERRLMEAYSWLVTAILCAVIVALCLELIDFGSRTLNWTGTAVAVYFAGLIVVHAVRRFFALLTEAQRYGSQSSCPGCQRQAAFDVISEAPQMRVRCRKCAHEWTFR